MNTLQMINEVQKSLRLPQSLEITDPHAQLILSLLNRSQRSMMLEAATWDELKRYGAVALKPGSDTFIITLTTGDEIDYIRSIQYDSGEEIKKIDDDDFRVLKRNAQTGKPCYYRNFSRSGNNVIIEVYPRPDVEYEAQVELMQKPPRLVNALDLPLLDADTIVLGALMLARAEQGENAQTELMSFQAKVGLLINNSNESNWGDMDPV